MEGGLCSCRTRIVICIVYCSSSKHFSTHLGWADHLLQVKLLAENFPHLRCNMERSINNKLLDFEKKIILKNYCVNQLEALGYGYY